MSLLDMWLERIETHPWSARRLDYVRANWPDIREDYIRSLLSWIKMIVLMVPVFLVIALFIQAVGPAKLQRNSGQYSSRSFVYMWSFIMIAMMFLLAELSGWRALAKRFKARVQTKGKTFYFQSAGIGTASFGSCLRMRVSSEGFYLAPLIPFTPFFAPLLIPWAEFKRVQEYPGWRRRKMAGMCLWIGSPAITTLCLGSKVCEAAQVLLPAAIKREQSTGFLRGLGGFVLIYATLYLVVSGLLLPINVF